MNIAERSKRLKVLAGEMMTIKNITSTKRIQYRGKPAASKYKGVYLRSVGKKKWRACIKCNRKPRHIGYFYNEIDAARAFDEVHREVYGEIGMINRDIYPDDFN